MKIINRLKYKRFLKSYRNLNKHNQTILKNYCDVSKIIVGKNTYGEINVIDWSSYDSKLYIGSYCSIAPGVQFILGGEHQTKSISTFPFKVKSFGYLKEALSKGDIKIYDDVWIGLNAIICSGVTIGQGAVIAAGSVVTKNIEPYSIVGGNPAHFIKWRFDENCRKKLQELDIVRLFDKFKKEDISLIYSDLTQEKLKLILEIYDV